jgi:transglutaminase-like putative cysteine protease
MRRRSSLSLALLGALLAGGPALAAEPPPTADEARAFLQSLLTASPYRLPPAALAGEIRYRLRFATRPGTRLPATGEQRAQREDDAVVVSVCSDCGDEPAPTPDALQRYLRPNAWVRSDDRAVRAFARAHARGLSVRTRMRTLTAAVRAHMSGPIDFRHYDDAATALRNRGGDCTEFAVLLAASARALGIPARIAHGISYSGRMSGVPHVFAPHAWVQAWDGTRWTSYDAALGRFDAGHIALLVGDGDPGVAAALNGTLRDLRVVDAVGVRDRAASDD